MKNPITNGIIRDSTAERVLAELERRDPRLKEEVKGHRYRTSCPYRPGSDSEAFIVWIDGPEHGGYEDHVSGDTGSLYELAEKIGVERAKPPAPAGKQQPAVTYDYVDHEGTLLYQVCRFEPGKDGRAKDFRQRRPDMSKPGEWIWGTKGVTKVLYRMPALLQAIAADQTIYLVEGEKDADNLTSMGITATTNVGGAGKWLAAYTTTLRGADVVILPDNDEPGRQHAAAVALAIYGQAQRVRIVDLPNLPPKGDVSDWLNAGHQIEELLALVEAAPDYEPPAAPQVAAEQDKPKSDTRTSGTRTSGTPGIHIRWGADIDQVESPRQLIKGYLVTSSVALFIGPSEAGKSTIAVDVICKVAQHYPAIYVAGEDAGNVRTQIRAWELTNQRQRGHLGLVDGPVLLANDNHVESFITAALPSAARLVVFDTLSSCSPGIDENSSDMTRVTHNLNRIADALGASVLVLHHPLKYSAEQFRGHSSLLNNTHTMWVAARDEGDEVVTLKVTRHKGKRADAATLKLLIRETDITDPDEGLLSAPVAVPVTSVIISDDHLTTRQKAILEHLESIDFDGGATTAELARYIAGAYKIQEGVARRDINSLAKRGLISHFEGQGKPRTITEKGRAWIGSDRVNRADRVAPADLFIVNAHLGEIPSFDTNPIRSVGATFVRQDALETKPDPTRSEPDPPDPDRVPSLGYKPDPPDPVLYTGSGGSGFPTGGTWEENLSSIDQSSVPAYDCWREGNRWIAHIPGGQRCTFGTQAEAIAWAQEQLHIARID